MRILEICIFSAGIDGVFSRVKQESLLLSKKHDVLIISSNLTKGSSKIAKSAERFGKVRIRRFPAKIMGGESYIKFDDLDIVFRNAVDFKPDVIIAHCYRHKSMDLALKVAKLTGKKCFLVTHAPFATDENRSFAGKIAVKMYDKFIGPIKLKGFNKVIAITNWERPYLRKLWVPDNKIEYIPNGIPEEFFKQPHGNENEKILFLGRISPIKNIEVLIKAMKIIEDKNIKLEIVGPAEKRYLEKLKDLVNKEGLYKKVTFSMPIYNLKEKIRKIDSAKVFVLPSKREAMPQALIEAMSRKKIVISSDNLGARELIDDGKNGFLFKHGNEKDLAEKIKMAFYKNDKMREEAKKSVEKFRWSNIIEKIENLIG